MRAQQFYCMYGILMIGYRNSFIHLLISTCAEGLCTHMWRWKYCVNFYSKCVKQVVSEDLINDIMKQLELKKVVDMTNSDRIHALTSALKVLTVILFIIIID